MQPITTDFVFTNVRIALIATVAYLGGAGYFSPAGVTLATALITSLLPILIPWAMSAYASWGVVKVPVDLTITKDDIQRASGNGAALAKDVIAEAKKAAPLILIAFLILPLAACATAPAGGGGTSTGDIQARVQRLCSFAVTTDTILKILKVDSGNAGQIASGICTALQSVPRFAIASLYQPKYKGVVIEGRWL